MWDDDEGAPSATRLYVRTDTDDDGTRTPADQVGKSEERVNATSADDDGKRGEGAKELINCTSGRRDRCVLVEKNDKVVEAEATPRDRTWAGTAILAARLGLRPRWLRRGDEGVGGEVLL